MIRMPRYLPVTLVAVALATTPALANTVSLSGTDVQNDVAVAASFSFDPPPDAVSDWSTVTSFIITFTPFDSSTFPAATFALADLPTIASESTIGSYPGFQYDGENGLNYLEYDGNDYSYSYYGFYLYTGDGVGYDYGVGGTLYSGSLANYTLTETVPEPASLALLGAGLLGTAAARHRKRSA